ncbi:hypothetical protein BH10BAC6_BH10BAC6_03300 [soil metagenome]
MASQHRLHATVLGGEVKLFLLAAFIVLSSVPARTQEYPPLLIGVAGGYARAVHTATSLTCLSDPACPPYSGGAGGGWYGAATLSWRASEHLGLAVALRMSPVNVKMTEMVAGPPVRNESGDVVTLQREHTLTYTATQFALDIGPEYTLGVLRFSIGASAGVQRSAKWSSSARIVSPNNITFGNDLRDTTFYPEQAVPNAASFLIGANAMVGLDLPISHSLRLSPEVRYAYTFTPLQADASWHQQNIFAGIGLRVALDRPSNEPEPEPEIVVPPPPPVVIAEVVVAPVVVEPVVVEPVVVTPIVVEPVVVEPVVVTPIVVAPVVPRIRIIDPSTNAPLRKLVISTTEQDETFPLLPVVFFDRNSDTIPQRYARHRYDESFNIDSITPSALPMYYEVLNVIGSRARNSKSILHLRGFADVGTEGGNCKLADDRANRVRALIASMWNIDVKNIIVDASNCTASSQTAATTEQGHAENRRVEISCEDPVVMSPTVRTRFTTRIGTTPLDPQVALDSIPLTSPWQIRVRNGGNLLYEERGTGPALVKWKIDENTRQRIALGQPLEIEATVDTITVRAEVPVGADITNIWASRLTLSLFSISSAELSPRDREAIKVFTAKLKASETLSVRGFTDNLGGSGYNKTLSVRRAQNVAAAIRALRPDVRINVVEGVGDSTQPFGLTSYALPEERFLSRTVQVEIKRSLK